MSSSSGVSVGEIHTDVQVEGAEHKAETVLPWEDRWRLREQQRELLHDYHRTAVGGLDD